MLLTQQNASPSPTSLSLGGPAGGITGPTNSNPNISIHDNKREYLKQKERQDLEALEADLKKEKEKIQKLEEANTKEMDDLKEKESEELTRVENGHKETLEMLNKEKDKIMGSLQEALEKENSKMEQMH